MIIPRNELTDGELRIIRRRAQDFRFSLFAGEHHVQAPREPTFIQQTACMALPRLRFLESSRINSTVSPGYRRSFAALKRGGLLVTTLQE